MKYNLITMKLFLSNLVGELGFECLIGKEVFDCDMGFIGKIILLSPNDIEFN